MSPKNFTELINLNYFIKEQFTYIRSKYLNRFLLEDEFVDQIMALVESHSHCFKEDCICHTSCSQEVLEFVETYLGLTKEAFAQIQFIDDGDDEYFE